ncbi:PREDICTED: uncharacterized protein LOC106103601 isoform X1 [Papilio polytes]|uniref:uncharacterized protein LOC106103601 isoform X1 n=1 Tax=Papilio polytes TaxID=76194 RepID=UPI000676A3F4|nr:PREDICTED: uncharacterized protein LOC106103601 isoform X1 [Papilio polytes]
MRSKILSLQKQFTSVFRRKYCNGVEMRRDAHMNELPVPCLPWQPWYTARQNWYNRFLAMSIAWWLFSFGMALYTDSIYLNWGPPGQPGPPSDMVDECVEAD